MDEKDPIRRETDEGFNKGERADGSGSVSCELAEKSKIEFYLLMITIIDIKIISSSQHTCELTKLNFQNANIEAS